MHRGLISHALSVAAVCVASFLWSNAAAAQQSPTKVLIVVGPSQHPPGTHEVAAGARLVEYCLEHAENLQNFNADVIHEWPTDRAALTDVSTVVFFGDLFPPAKMEQSERIMADLAGMMDRGCGMVCVHYATGLGAADVGPDGEHPLLHWMGGYFATRCQHHQSVARVMTATIQPGEADHPVLRGWKPFTLEEEPYYNNYFGNSGLASGVTALATSMLPPEAPKKEIVAWSIQRPDGGRGMGVVMPHFIRSWKVDDLRKFILNGVAWSAKVEVPLEGVNTKLPDLAMFEPAAVEPQPRPRNAKKQ